jgi:Tfp pilus assembly protein PilZ
MTGEHLRKYPRISGDYPVLLIAGDVTYKARASTLGGKGLFLQICENFALGTTLKVRFRPAKHLPEIEARAIVRSQVPGQGIGIEFTTIKPEHHEMLLRLIHHRMEEKRQHPRAPFVAQIEHAGGMFLGLSRNISAGGIFVQMKKPLAIGTQLKLRFNLDDGGPIVEAGGEVLYAVPKEGIGVRLTSVTDADMKRIEKYVGQGMADVPKPE